jgi:hypothetical protein
MATEDILGGAAQGAASGTAVAPGYGTAIGAGVGAISGFMAGRRREKAAAQERARQRHIRNLATPEHLKDVMTSLQPMFREVVAAGLGPQFQESVAQSLAQHGLTGTGAGEAIRGGAVGAPAMFATEMAGQKAGEVVRGQLAAEGLAGEAPMPPENPLLSALFSGARGFISGGGSLNFKKPGAPNSPALFPGDKSSDYTSLPNLTPTPTTPPII